MARGQPDEETYQPRVMPEDLPRKVVPEMSGASFGGGIAAIGDTLEKKYQADSAAWAGDQLAQFRVKVGQTLDQMKTSLPSGQDPGDFAGKFMKAFDDQAKPFADNDQVASNPYAHQMLSRGIGDLRDALSTHAMQFEAQQRVAYRADSFQNNLSSQLPLVEAHPELADQVGSTLADQVRAMGVEPSQQYPLLRSMHQELSQAAANGLTRQNPQGMLQALNEPENAPPAIKDVLSGLTDPQREAVLTKAKDQVASGYSDSIVNTYRAQGPTVGNKALLAIDSSGQPDDIKAQIYQKVEQGVNQWHQESRSALTPQIVALEARIASGDASEGDKANAWSLYNKGALDTNQLSSTIGSITRSQQKGQDDAEKLQFATNAYQQKTPLDPKDTRTKDAVDLLFGNMTKGVQPGSPGYNNATTEMVSRVGIVPASAENWARANLTSGSPQAAASAANLLAHIQATNPRAQMFAEDPKLKAMSASINDAVQAGTDPLAAVTMARSNAAMSEAETKTLTDRFTKFAPQQLNALNSILKGDPNFKPGIFSSLPAVPLAMQTDFNKLTSDYFTHTNGNIAQSRQLAVQDLKNTWGVTQVNGKREFMQYAPEAMHPELTTEALRSDIEKSTAGMTADPTKVRLVPNATTPYTNGNQWTLAAPDKNGMYGVLLDKRNNPLIYVLPTPTQLLKSKATADALDQLGSDLQQRKLDTAGAALEGMGRLHEKMEEIKAANANPKGQEFIQGRRGGY
jgi:hypothetical protein